MLPPVFVFPLYTTVYVFVVQCAYKSPSSINVDAYPFNIFPSAPIIFVPPVGNVKYPSNVFPVCVGFVIELILVVPPALLYHPVLYF